MFFSQKIIFSLYLRYGLKVGVACTLAYLFTVWTNSSYSVWAVVSSIIAMQLNVAESFQAGLWRITGTVAGTVVGTILLLFLPRTPIAIACCVFFIGTFFGLLAKYGKMFSTASVTASVILLSGSMYIQSYAYLDAIIFGLLRTVEILIGVGAAFFVSIFMWPVRLSDTLQTDINLQFRESARALDSIAGAFLAGQEHLDENLLVSLSEKIWSNHERFIKVKTHESFFSSTINMMEIQMNTLDRVVEYLHIMLDSLNSYDEAGKEILIAQEFKELSSAIGQSMYYMGGSTPGKPNPIIVQDLTAAIDSTECRLDQLNRHGEIQRSFNLHKGLQLFTVYQTMRMLCEVILLNLDKMQNQRYGMGK